MTRIVITSIVLLFLSINPLQAQRSKFEIGLEGGPNASYFWGDYSPKSNHSYKKQYAFSGTAGVTFQWNPKPHFSLRTGISYEQKALNTTASYSDVLLGNSSTDHTRSEFNYLALPLLARFTYGGKVQFFSNTGIFMGLLTGQRSYSKRESHYLLLGNPVYSSSTSSYSDIGKFKKIDFGIIAGMGIGIPIKKQWHLSFEVRENLGILNIDYKSHPSEKPVGTSSLNLLVGVSYRLGAGNEK